MRNLNVGSCLVHTDFWAIDPHTEKLVMASLVSNSKGELASATASIQLGSEGSIRMSDDSLPRHYFEGSNEGYSVFAEAIEHGKTSVIHALLWAKDILTERGSCFAVTEGSLQKGLFDHLYRRFNLPLLDEWADGIRDMLMEREAIYAIDIQGEAPDWKLYRVTITEDAFKELIREGLQSGRFTIAKTPQQPLVFKDLDQYYMKYGEKIIRQLEQRINPLTERIQTVEVMTKKKNLFPEQAEMVNAMQALLKTANYCIVNQGMGCGKTLQGAVTIEKIGIDAVKEFDLQKSVEQAAYRSIIMCPGHLVEKWKDEIEGEIPLATATILRDFAQVTALDKLKGTKPSGKEFYIFSKDFAKLSYQEMPIVRNVRKRPVRFVKCDKCDKQIPYGDYKSGKRSCNCEAGGMFRLEDHHHRQNGLVCPECGELAWPIVQKLKIGDDFGSEEKHRPLMPIDFSEKTDRNRCCSACGTTLWGPNLQNYSISGTVFGEWVENRTNPWIRITHHLNQAKKGTKSVWVHKKYMHSYLEMKKLEPGDYSIIRNSGVRKYAPAAFIKKRLPNFFDFAVFDEFHEYKGGDTAQGHAMHCLVKASKKQLCLTGTIAGGVATHLFHLMYRLDPGKMLEMGYKHTDELKFAQDYGVVETVTVRETENGVYNSSSRGKKSQTISVKPGISPLLYSMFLLDRTVFLDLEDLAAYLPPLYEYVRTVGMDPDVMGEYNRLRQRFKTLLNEKGGKKLLASMLQSLLAYPDKPFGFNPVLCPATGNALIHFEEHNQDKLYPKEVELLDIVRAELKEGRNSVIYLEYTGKGDKNVVNRLKEILEKNLDLKDKVAVLNSNSPEPSKREAWLKKQAVDGKKVIIANPRCVQTGLDFVFDIQGKTYNYPTLVFYQLGYNLFTLWQASRRHYRLSQKEECRTFYLAYSGTLQEGVVNIMADKKVATAAIQGKFSSEGLSAMAQSVDAQVELAKMLLDRDTSNAKELEEKFAMINSVQNQCQGVKAEPVKTTRRWTGQPLSPVDLFQAMEAVIEQIEFSIVEKASRTTVEGQLSFI